MAEYKHGSMDISNQEKTFEGFIHFAIRAVIVVLCILIFLAIFNT